jgi:DNA repair photolyase
MELLSWAGDRVFIDVASAGCGSGCTYCYISHPNGAQVVASRDDVHAAVENLLEDTRFHPGALGTIISLSPSSEPFKSSESTDRTSQVLRKVIPLGNPVQIATKERVAARVWAAIADAQVQTGQVVVFISVSTLRKTAALEPQAALPAIRFLNFEAGRTAGIRTCLYVKPFLAQTSRELDAFVHVVEEHRPDAVCVGILYTNNPTHKQGHPVFTEWTSPGMPESGTAFRTAVARTGVPTFYNAGCVNAYFLDRRPAVPIWSKFPQLCVGCRPCAADEQGLELGATRSSSL